MRKRIVQVAFAVAIALVSGINVFNAQKAEVLSDTALANVEALAQSEASGPCKGYGTVYCTYNAFWVEYQYQN